MKGLAKKLNPNSPNVIKSYIRNATLEEDRPVMTSAPLRRIPRAYSLLVLVVFACLSARTLEADGGNDLNKYSGRYSNGPFSLFTVEAVDDYLAIVPPFWTSKPYLKVDSGDEFSMRVPHIDSDRRVKFVLDDAGKSTALEAFSFDTEHARYERLDDGVILPIEHFLAGNVKETLTSLDSYTGVDEHVYTSVAYNILAKYPTKHTETSELLSNWVHSYPESAQLNALYGYALLADSQRDDAIEAFEAAIEIDPEESMSSEALRRLRSTGSAKGEGYRTLFPYDLDALFQIPTDAEIDLVKLDWEKRDLRPVDINTVAVTTLELEYTTYDVRIVGHRVHSDLHYGAILTPQDLDDEPVPVVLEARGVDPNYTPLDISEGTQLMRALGVMQDRFIFVIPSLRGETLTIQGQSYTSEGDRSDSWDGAADDTIALLSVALKIETATDLRKIAVYGKSRGGSIALLAGIRDERINLVLNLAGPVDWFRAMENKFWSTEEVLRDMLRDGRPLETTQEGGQFYERFIAPVARGEWNLADSRHNMIAGSPLYFLETLPLTYSFYGREDRSVPVVNAELMQGRMTALGRYGSDFFVTIYEGRGHDTEPLLAYQAMVEALTVMSEY